MPYSVIPITPGTGANIAVDVVSGQNIEIIKLDAGSSGASVPVSAANPLPAGPPKSNTASVALTSGIGTSNALILSANPSRKYYYVENTGTKIVYIREDSSAASATVYTHALAPCAAANDGSGGGWTSSFWTGAVQAISQAAGGSVVVTEYT